MAIVGALRKLATDAVVINARVSHVMYVGFATALTAGAAIGRSAGTSMDAMRYLRIRKPNQDAAITAAVLLPERG
jgi:hypothetical protein